MRNDRSGMVHEEQAMPAFHLEWMSGFWHSEVETLIID